ncbi:hypothetical protein FOYG_17199 [Fusarium oxysporum NRRL 32931]|uniref:SMP domain-containing protein n=1 Tax=Fusarium oxysporum NRRL 32931 TaxID=660029 RepID=W9HF77_FUSOX|nr:hypothetical protein FOYG_17199 [Fusarium oxysporum NRRL 32931]
MSSQDVIQAAAGAAEETDSLGSMQLQRSVTQLEAAKGRGSIEAPYVEGPKKAQEVEQLTAAGVSWAAEAAEARNVKQQDAANVVWAAKAADVGRTGSRG